MVLCKYVLYMLFFIALLHIVYVFSPFPPPSNHVQAFKLAHNTIKPYFL